MEHAKVKFESDPQAWAWIKGDIARAKAGRPHDEVEALALCEGWGFDLEKVRASYAEARAFAVNQRPAADPVAPPSMSIAAAGRERLRKYHERLAAEEKAKLFISPSNAQSEQKAKLEPVTLPAVLPPKAELPADPEIAVSTETMLAAMNERHAVIGNIGGKCLALDWIKDPVDDTRLIPSFQSRRDVENRYSRWRVTVEGPDGRKSKVGLRKWWWDHPQRSDYRGVSFEPGGPLVLADNLLNLWRGWGVVPKAGDWSRMRWHIENILAGGDSRAAEYVLRWSAYGFQHPNRPAEVALIFRGPEGCGKGVFGRAVRTIYGPHGFQISQPRHLTGNFNAHLWTCCFLFADEAFWAGDRQGEGILKSLITEDTLMIEKKKIDQFQARNFIKLMMASNESWVIPAGQNARRYVVLDVDKRFAEGFADDVAREAYFGPLYAELANGGLEAMLFDLLHLDLGGWHPRLIYRTAALTRQKKVSLRGNRQWFEVLLQRGALPKPLAGQPRRIKTDDLIEWARGYRGCEYLNDTSLAEFLREEMGFTDANRYRLPKGGKRGWEFPLLSDCRCAWEKLYGGAWDWDEALEDWGA